MIWLGYNWLRYDFRCPVCGSDVIVIAPETAAMLRCACKHWSLVKELRGLRTKFFAPSMPDGTVHSGYTGAVKTSEPKEGFRPDYDSFVDAV